MGEQSSTFQAEQNALRAGIEVGMTLIDSAEMYGDGAAESLVGASISGLQREDLFLVSKVYPFGAWGQNIWICICSTGAAPFHWQRRLPVWKS